MPRWSPPVAVLAEQMSDRPSRPLRMGCHFLEGTQMMYSTYKYLDWTTALAIRPLSAAPTQCQRNSTSSSTNIMVALHRDVLHRDASAPLSDCCARTLIQHLAFDPELQDRVWNSTRAGRRNPPPRCSGYPKTGACNLPKLLDSIGFDPVAQTLSWQRSKEPPGKDIQLGTLVVNFSHPASRMLKSPNSSIRRNDRTSLIRRHHQKAF